MSALGSRVTLTHRTSILRNAGAGNSWGGHDADYQTLATDVPCRAWFLMDKPATKPEEITPVANWHLALAPDVDVTRYDLIGPVTDRGVTILAGPTYRVENLIRYPDRIELILKVDG